MATVVDSLVVLLNLDPTQFTQGQKDALAALQKTREGAVASGKDIEAQGKKVTEYFGSLKMKALGMVAVFLGGARGIAEFTSFVTHLDASTGRLARTMNISASELSAWQGAAEQTGGSAEGASSAIGGRR